MLPGQDANGLSFSDFKTAKKFSRHFLKHVAGKKTKCGEKFHDLREGTYQLDEGLYDLGIK